MGILLTVGAILFLSDIVLNALFVPAYYLTGPLVLRFSRHVISPGASLPTPDSLQRELRSFFLGNLVFVDFGGYTYGFRRSLFHGSGILQCVIQWSPQDGMFKVEGRVGWLFFGSIASILIAIAPDLATDPAPLVILVIFGILTLVDYVNCRRAASVAERLWSPPWSLSAA
jgi:hypothetical protein